MRALAFHKHINNYFVKRRNILSMKKSILEMKTLRKYKEYLYEEERSQATITKYMRDVMQFYHYLPEGYKAVSYTHLDVYKRQEI